MSTDPIIPAAVKLAAKRGFVRTSTQSLATGFAVPGALTLTFTGDGLLALGLALAGMVFTAVVNGAQSALSIISNGVPKDYADVALVRQAVLDPKEAAASVDTAVQRVSFRGHLADRDVP